MYNLQMESLKRSLVSLRRRYTVFMYNLQMESLKRSLASLRRRYTIFMYTCKWNPSKGVWHPSEGGTLYLCILVNGIPQ